MEKQKIAASNSLRVRRETPYTVESSGSRAKGKALEQIFSLLNWILYEKSCLKSTEFYP